MLDFILTLGLFTLLFLLTGAFPLIFVLSFFNFPFVPFSFLDESSSVNHSSVSEMISKEGPIKRKL